MPIQRTPVSDQVNNSKNNKSEAIEFMITEPKYILEDIILPEDTKKKLIGVLSFIKNQDLILNQWGLGKVVKNCNLSINLYGVSGTGKTMTAHAIASELRKNLVLVNYAELESKYVGETAKNLQSLFQFGKNNDVVIMFDEADALLSKRVTSMQSATDVSVNQTRNVLLKLLDDYDGVVIFTTNFIENFDSAFTRRIFSHIRFDYPDEDVRRRLWEHYLIPTLPIENRNALIEGVIEENELSGADISTIVLKAAIETADSPDQVLILDYLKNGINEIKAAKKAVDGNYEISTRKVTKEYALSQLRMEEK